MRAEVLAAAAEEHAKHVVYYSTRYDGKGVVKWQDDGGLHCTCDWSVPPEGQGPRPWPRWHEHVVAAALDAALAAQEGDQGEALREAQAKAWDEAHVSIGCDHLDIAPGCFVHVNPYRDRRAPETGATP